MTPFLQGQLYIIQLFQFIHDYWWSKLQDFGDVARSFLSTIKDDIAEHEGNLELHHARAAWLTISAERKFMQMQVREAEMRLKALKDATAVVESRLSAAAYQVGLIRAELNAQNIPVNNDVSLSDDSDGEALDIIYSELHRPTSPLP
jgi:hypothetical protein